MTSRRRRKSDHPSQTPVVDMAGVLHAYHAAIEEAVCVGPPTSAAIAALAAVIGRYDPETQWATRKLLDITIVRHNVDIIVCPHDVELWRTPHDVLLAAADYARLIPYETETETK